jgi:hypothetical protein
MNNYHRGAEYTEKELGEMSREAQIPDFFKDTVGEWGERPLVYQKDRPRLEAWG